MKHGLSATILGLSLIIGSSSYASMKDAYKKETSCNRSNATHTTKTFGGDNAYYCLTKDGKIYRTSDSQYNAGYKGQIGTKDYQSSGYVGNLYYGAKITEWSLENGDIYTYECSGDFECEGQIKRELFARKIQQQSSSSSNDANSFYNKAIKLHNAGDLQGALKYYSKSIEIDPNFSSPYINRGIVKKNLGDLLGAMDDYNQAINIKPNHANTYNNRAILKFNLKDEKGACDDYKKAIKLGHKSATNWFQTDGASWCRNM